LLQSFLQWLQERNVCQGWWLYVVVAVGLGPSSEVLNFKEVLDVNFGKAILRPMPGTLHHLPWAAEGKHHIGEVLCESFWMSPYHDGAHQGACTRYLARTQLERLSALGYRFMSGHEAEFFMFRKDGDGEVTSRPLFQGVDIYSNFVLSEHEELVCSMGEQLSTAGVDVESMHTENAPGLLELATAPKFGIESADQMFTLKEAVKEISNQNGCHATFMSQPVNHIDGFSSMHFNLSLWKGEKNAFHDPETHGLSEIGRHWAAGLVKHAAALSALLLPTVNCYRRLHSSPWEPAVANSGWEHRGSMLRIVATSPRTTYIENRLPSTAANPYVVMAATVAAGIDGLVNRLEQPSDTEEKLPSSLEEAVTALEADKVMLDAMGEEFIRWFLSLKREVEIAKVNKAKEDGRDEMEVERELYFKLL